MGYPVNDQTVQPGSDGLNDWQRVAQGPFVPAAISTATTTTVKAGAGVVHEIRVLGGTLGNVTVYDNTAASGTILVPTVTPVANGILLRNVAFFTGLTIVTAAATVVVVGYK